LASKLRSAVDDLVGKFSSAYLLVKLQREVEVIHDNAIRTVSVNSGRGSQNAIALPVLQTKEQSVEASSKDQQELRANIKEMVQSLVEKRTTKSRRAADLAFPSL